MTTFLKTAGLFIAALVFLSPELLRAAEPTDPPAPPAPKKVTSVEGVTEYRLDNGFRVLLYPDPSTPKVTVICNVLVGSRHEGYGETGMAHLLEHMTFKGTPTNADLKKLLSDRGAKFGATTSFDQTWYYETLAGTDDNLRFAVALEADRLQNSLIEREALASEMGVVRNEFRDKDNNEFGVLMQRVLATAYEWHNYGKVPVGNLSDIERIPADRLRAFYRKHYRPDNAVLVVAGKFDEAKALEYAARHFGPLKNPEEKLEKTSTEEPAQDGERTVTLRRVGTTGMVMAAYHIPAASHPDFAPLVVLQQVLGAEPRGRLYKALVASKKSPGVGADVSEMHDPGVFLLIAGLGLGQSSEEVRGVLLDTVETLGTNKVTVDEVRQARAELTGGWKSASGSSIAEGLRLWSGCGDWRLLFLHRDRVNKVTADDVNRVAAKYLVRSNRTVGEYVPTAKPERAAVPATPNVAATLKDYTGGKAIAAGEEFDPTPENIEKRLKFVTLPSGVKAALMPRKTRGETVTLRLTLRYGNEQSLAGLREVCGFMPALMARGTRGHTYEAIDRLLTEMDGAGISADGGTGYLEFTIVCRREHLTAAVKLMGEMLREPTFPKEEFETMKRAVVEAVRGQLTDPAKLSDYALTRKLNPYPRDDLRYQATLEELIAEGGAVTVEQIRKLYETQVGGANGELVVVGDFDPDATVRQVQGLLEGWKTTTPYRRIAGAADTTVPGGSVVIHTADKSNAVYRAGHLIAQRYTDADYPALTVGNHIFGRGMTSRLWNRLREKDGLCYGVQSSYFAGGLDPKGGFTFFAICSPADMPKVRAGMAEEIERLLKDGVTAEELDSAKKAILAGRRTFTDGEIVVKLADDLVEGDSFAATAERTRKMGAVTVEQVNAALRKHLQPKKLVVVEAGDFPR